MIQFRLIVLSTLTVTAINSQARLAEAFVPFDEQRSDIVAEILTPQANENQAALIDKSGWDGYVDQYDPATMRDEQVASTAVQLELPESSATLRCHQTGVASWYGGRSGGEKTANGERLDGNAMTAANKTLPFGTRVRVTNRKNGRSVVVRINDRGPYISGRIIDLSYAAKTAIGMDGLDAVQLECV